MDLFHNQVGGNQAAAEVHGNKKVNVDDLPSRELFFAYKIGCGNGEAEVEQGAKHRVKQGIGVSPPDAGFIKGHLVGFQRKALDPEDDIAFDHFRRL